MSADPAVDLDLLREVEQFIFREARYCDEHAYDDWEALWSDDAIYWVPARPANGDDPDPEKHMSIIYDNRSRISTRIKQYHTGKRHSQVPKSGLRRLVSNVELLEADQRTAEDDVRVGANFVVYESRERGITLWAGRVEYHLRRSDGGWRMSYKKVMLVDDDRALNTLAFLI